MKAATFKSPHKDCATALEDYVATLERGVTVEEKPHFGLGDKLRRLRMQEGWTQEEMARRAKVHHSVISRVESGKGNPTLKTIQKVADVLGVEIRLVSKTRAFVPLFIPPITVVKS